MIYPYAMDKMNDIWQDCPIVNTWNDVFDEGISKGYTNWQLYGSCKPNHEAYKVTSKYNISYDNQDGEIINEQISIDAKKLTKEMFKEFSIRNKEHPQYFYKSSFLNQLESTTTTQPQRKSSPVTTIFDDESGSKDITKIRTKEQLQSYLDMFLDSIQPSEYILRELYEYTTVLPESYYGSGSYTKWIRVGWALKNTSNKLLVVWLVFSALDRVEPFSGTLRNRCHTAIDGEVPGPRVLRLQVVEILLKELQQAVSRRRALLIVEQTAGLRQQDISR